MDKNEITNEVLELIAQLEKNTKEEVFEEFMEDPSIWLKENNVSDSNAMWFVCSILDTLGNDAIKPVSRLMSPSKEKGEEGYCVDADNTHKVRYVEADDGTFAWFSVSPEAIKEASEVGGYLQVEIGIPY